MRRAAAEALGRLGRAEEAAEILLALARDERVEAGVRRDAAEALGRLGRAEEAAEILRPCTLMSGWRPGCAGRLPGRWARLGQAEEAAEILPALARDERVEAWVRRDAAEALGRLGRAEDLLRFSWPGAG